MVKTPSVAESHELEESAELFRLLVGSVRDYAIFMLDPKGYVSTWNAGAERFKGYKAPEIIGRHFSTFYPEEDIRAGKCEMELEVATREGRFEDEGWRVRKDGTQFWANVVITAVRDETGKLIGFAKVTRDLTDRKRSEEERAARLAAEQASRAKDEFLAMLGHELRNPLSPIVTAIQLLKLRAETPLSKEHEVIERQVKQLMRLVDDLLDVSRITRGKIVLHRQVVDLRDVIAKSVEIASPLLDQKGHTFEIGVPPHALTVEGDEARLVQVFANILNNAAKYTDPGGQIHLQLSETGDQIVVDVRDNGVGIDAELLPRVFDLFVQGHQGSDRATGGLGLGLPLVRSLVQLHGGQVEVRSAGQGMGSTFTVRLPRATKPRLVAANDPAQVFTAAPNTRKVLIVDDNEDARLLLADVLAAVGHDVRTAADGPGALALLGDFAPDVAVLDIGLPGMDGYELARKVRALPGGRNMSLVALSGYGQPSDRAHSAEAGFDQHMTKPVEIQRLLRHIGHVPQRRS